MYLNPAMHIPPLKRADLSLGAQDHRTASYTSEIALTGPQSFLFFLNCNTHSRGLCAAELHLTVIARSEIGKKMMC